MSLSRLVHSPIGIRSLLNSPSLTASPWLLQRFSHQSPALIPTKTRSVFNIKASAWVAHRSFHTGTTSPIKFRFNSGNPPRFNQGPPSTFGFLLHLIPDGLKAIFLIMGFSAFVLFFMGPLLIITVPPLVIGGFLLRKTATMRRSSVLKRQYENLKETHLTYQGSELDESRLSDFVTKRIIQGLKTNEAGLTEKLGLVHKGQGNIRSQHSWDSRFGLSGIETIDQDFQVSTKLGIREKFTVLSFGLYDSDQDLARIATVVVTLRPRAVATLLDVGPNQTHDAVIEVSSGPLDRSPVVLNDSNDFKEPPTINIRPNRGQ